MQNFIKNSHQPGTRDSEYRFHGCGRKQKKFREITENPNASITGAAVFNFTKQYKLKIRRKQRNKNVPKEAHRLKLMEWHANLREKLIRPGQSAVGYSTKYGHFDPSRQLNVDQVPLPFAMDASRTYKNTNIPTSESRNKKVSIAQPGSGLDKRQATLQLCFSPDDTIVRPALIFRGKGKVCASEKSMYNAGVDIYWQTNV